MEVRTLWRECVIVRDGDDWMTVQCAWGVTPGHAYIPDVITWNRVVPEAWRSRRDEIASAIQTFGLDVVVDDIHGGTLRFGSGPDPRFNDQPYTLGEVLGPFPLTHREP